MCLAVTWVGGGVRPSCGEHVQRGEPLVFLEGLFELLVGRELTAVVGNVSGVVLPAEFFLVIRRLRLVGPPLTD